MNRYDCLLWGWLLARGVAWSRWAAAATTGLLVVVFTWRASASWLAAADGAAGKLTAAVLITLMGVASIVMLLAPLMARKDRVRNNG